MSKHGKNADREARVISNSHRSDWKQDGGRFCSKDLREKLHQPAWETSWWNFLARENMEGICYVPFSWSCRILQETSGTFPKPARRKWGFSLARKSWALKAFGTCCTGCRVGLPIGAFAGQNDLKMIQSMTKHCWQRSPRKSVENGLFLLPRQTLGHLGQ